MSPAANVERRDGNLLVFHDTTGGVVAAASRQGSAAERDREIEQRRFALLEPKIDAPGEATLASLLLLQGQVEAEPLRVVGDASRRLLQRLAEHGQELATPRHAPVAWTASPDGTVTSY